MGRNSKSATDAVTGSGEGASGKKGAVGVGSGSGSSAGQSATDAAVDYWAQSMMSADNADLLADALCRMRGAALKLGQLLSIQDDSLIPPQL